MTDDARPSECVCKENKEESTFKCTECTRRVHWTCTELPVYQLCVFIKTHRRYTCRPCAKAYMDDSTTEEVELAKTVTQTTDDRQSQDSTRYDTVYSQLRANHQTTTTLLQTLETAINNLAGQVHRAEEIRGDAMAHLDQPAIKTGSQPPQLTNQHRRPRRRQPIRPSRLTGLYR